MEKNSSEIRIPTEAFNTLYLEGIGCLHRKSFDTFDPQGECQEEALRLCRAIADGTKGQKPAHNRIVLLTGGSGIGKTHLLKATANGVIGPIPTRGEVDRTAVERSTGMVFFGRSADTFLTAGILDGNFSGWGDISLKVGGMGKFYLPGLTHALGVSVKYGGGYGVEDKKTASPSFVLLTPGTHRLVLLDDLGQFTLNKDGTINPRYLDQIREAVRGLALLAESCYEEGKTALMVTSNLTLQQITDVAANPAQASRLQLIKEVPMGDAGARDFRTTPREDS
ncbi:MAG: hypothetical protein WC846_01850 [Candidatus Gracilibacteria bacterium]|jgi:hypothetical protein